MAGRTFIRKGASSGSWTDAGQWTATDGGGGAPEPNDIAYVGDPATLNGPANIGAFVSDSEATFAGPVTISDSLDLRSQQFQVTTSSSWAISRWAGSVMWAMTSAR